MKVIRLLVYEGPENWISYQRGHDSVKGTHVVGPEKKITSVYLGSHPDELSIALASIDKIIKENENGK
jgi:hypothetical protein